METLPVPLRAQNGNRTVVAHRGASAYLPEHTLAAYAMAYAQGADYIEPDVLLTRDDVLICLHDLYLETTTDAAARFPERKRADGHYYAADFDLAEIKSLSVFGRVSEPERDAIHGHTVVTLEELLLLVQQLNAKTRRQTGLLIETKDPAFHQKENRPLEKPLLDILTRYGYADPDGSVIIQSFDAPHLKLLRYTFETELPLMYLVDTLPSAATIEEVSIWADGINPGRNALDIQGEPTPGAAAFLRQAREKNLRVLVWTFREDEQAMAQFLFDYGIDGVITNNPDAGVRVVQSAKSTDG